ncbi:Transposable element Tc3 transposase, partial [Stegodyphus mimosarum]
MDWSAYSPDLNPIEHVWDALRRRIAARLHSPENTQQLKQMLIEEWALLPQEMLHQLVLTTGRLVSMSTVRRRLHKGGLYAVLLTSRHWRDYLQLALQHVHWTPDPWRAVLFRDESRFSLESDSRRYLIWREPGIRYHPSNIRERDAYGRGSVCV